MELIDSTEVGSFLRVFLWQDGRHRLLQVWCRQLIRSQRFLSKAKARREYQKVIRDMKKKHSVKGVAI